jgi:hypothetical protein
MRHENIETTMRYYVGRNADTVADAVWKAYEGQIGNNYGNNGLLEKATEQIVNNATPCNENNFSSTPGRTRTCNQRIRNAYLTSVQVSSACRRGFVKLRFVS